MNHYGMIGKDGITTCSQCLSYLNKIGAGAEKECYDCYNADEWGKPKKDAIPQVIQRPIVNVTYQTDMENTPYMKAVRDELQQLKARLHLYFKERNGEKELPF